MTRLIQDTDKIITIYQHWRTKKGYEVFNETMYRIIDRGIHEINEKAQQHEQFLRDAIDDYINQLPDNT